MRTNPPALASGLLGSPVATLEELDAPDVSLFHAARTGWMIVRGDRLSAKATSSTEFDAALSAELRDVVQRRFPISLLLPGRALDGPAGRALELEVTCRPDGGTPVDPPALEPRPLVLFVPDRAELARWSDRPMLGMQFFPLRERLPERVVLRERALPDESRRVERELRPAQAEPWIASSAARLGSDTGASLDLLLRLAREAGRITWSGRFDGVERGWELGAQAPDDRRPARERCPEPDAPAASAIDESRAFGAMVPGLVTRRIASGWLVVNPATGEPVLLDEQAKLLLDTFDGRTSLAELAELAAEVFSDERAYITLRLRSYVDALVARAILTDARSLPSAAVTLPTRPESDGAHGGLLDVVRSPDA